jgi:hypothetical protein
LRNKRGRANVADGQFLRELISLSFLYGALPSTSLQVYRKCS